MFQLFYSNSSIKSFGGILLQRLQGGQRDLLEKGLIRGGAYPQSQMTRIRMNSFLFLFSPNILRSQNTTLRVKYTNSSQLLSEAISKVTCKSV